MGPRLCLTRSNNIFQALGSDGVFLVRQLQEFDFVNDSSGAVSELLSHIAALHSGVESLVFTVKSIRV